MTAPLSSVGPPLAPVPSPGAGGAAAPGFQAALATALETATTSAPAGAAPATAPTAVPLARMLAVLAGRAGVAPAPAWAGAGAVGALGSAPQLDSGALDSGALGGGDAIVAAAERYLGIPYRWGGSDPATGLDCSGLVQLALGDLGVSVPRTSVEQSRVGAPVASLADARPGDLLFWASTRPGQANHIGIYVGGGQMLHAPYTGEVVRVAPVRTAPPTTIRRLAG